MCEPEIKRKIKIQLPKILFCLFVVQIRHLLLLKWLNLKLKTGEKKEEKFDFCYAEFVSAMIMVQSRNVFPSIHWLSELNNSKNNISLKPSSRSVYSPLKGASFYFSNFFIDL